MTVAASAACDYLAHARTHARGQRAWKVPFGSPGAVRGGARDIARMSDTNGRF